MSDPTENIRRDMVESGQPQVDLEIEKLSKQLCPWLLAATHDEDTCEWCVEHRTWDTDALRRDFEPLSFMAPFIVVRRKSDGKKGTLEFTHSPRVYFNWREDG